MSVFTYVPLVSRVFDMYIYTYIHTYIHDNVQVVTWLFFVGVWDHTEGQSVIGMKMSVFNMILPTDLKIRCLIHGCMVITLPAEVWKWMLGVAKTQDIQQLYGSTHHNNTLFCVTGGVHHCFVSTPPTVEKLFSAVVWILDRWCCPGRTRWQRGTSIYSAACWSNHTPYGMWHSKSRHSHCDWSVEWSRTVHWRPWKYARPQTILGRCRTLSKEPTKTRAGDPGYSPGEPYVSLY